MKNALQAKPGGQSILNECDGDSQAGKTGILLLVHVLLPMSKGHKKNPKRLMTSCGPCRQICAAFCQRWEPLLKPSSLVLNQGSPYSCLLVKTRAAPKTFHLQGSQDCP